MPRIVDVSRLSFLIWRATVALQILQLELAPQQGTRIIRHSLQRLA